MDGNQRHGQPSYSLSYSKRRDIEAELHHSPGLNDESRKIEAYERELSIRGQNSSSPRKGS